MNNKKIEQTKTSSWGLVNDNVQDWAYMENVFTPEECERIIKIGENRFLNKALINQNLYAPEIRDCEICWLYPVDDMGWVFSRLTDVVQSLNKDFFNFDLFGFVEGFQFTKYVAPSNFYDLHTDRKFDSVVRKLSLSIELSSLDSFKGGELGLYLNKIPCYVKKQQGQVTAFPSYVLHEVTPVTEGTRYSLVTWITGKPFK